MDEITLQVIGCGDAFSTGGRFTTCFYVKTASLNFLIDCGATSLVALKQQGISTSDVDLILISHFHGDHFGGLPFFILDAALVEKRQKPLTIISPPGCRGKLEKTMDLFYPGVESTSHLDIRYIEYAPYQSVQHDDLIITAFPVIHSEETLPHALRISISNKIISFSGDTEWTDELYAASDQADLFICECNFFEKEVKGHITYTTLLQKSQRLTCSKLLLTHLGKEMLENASDIAFDCAEDGKSFIV